MEFRYDMSRDYRPIPPGERALPCLTAEKFHLVTRERPKRLEGVTFDKNGDMYFTSNYEGRDVDDVAFDENGYMYYTHFTGTVYNSAGAVYRVTPDLEREEVFIPNLCSPNGICFSPDYGVMWITEFTAGRLLRVPMNNLGLGCVVYHFTGHHGPDSCETDGDGNIYVCMFNQGRIMVFSPDGFPVGQILMPNRDVGHNLNGAHATVRPGELVCYIACSDDIGNEGSWIMKAPAMASGNGRAFNLI